MCKQKNPYLEVHHINAIYAGGTNQEKNLITLCKECHSKITKLDHSKHLYQDNRNETEIAIDKHHKKIEESLGWWGIKVKKGEWIGNI